jgi:hypothetical protein
MLRAFWPGAFSSTVASWVDIAPSKLLLMISPAFVRVAERRRRQYWLHGKGDERRERNSIRGSDTVDSLFGMMPPESRS